MAGCSKTQTQRAAQPGLMFGACSGSLEQLAGIPHGPIYHANAIANTLCENSLAAFMSGCSQPRRHLPLSPPAFVVILPFPPGASAHPPFLPRMWSPRAPADLSRCTPSPPPHAVTAASPCQAVGQQTRPPLRWWCDGETTPPTPARPWWGRLKSELERKKADTLRQLQKEADEQRSALQSALAHLPRCR